MPTLGTSSADNLVGTGDADMLSGLEGNDTLLGLGGDDILVGGAGNDSLDGGDGNDILMDDAGSNALLGGAGDDTILATAVAYINGGDGNDSIFASGAGSTILGGLGNDWIFFGASGTATGGPGSDTFSLLGSFGYPNGSPAAPVVVTDFTPGASGDRLDLVPWLSGASTTGFTSGNPFGGSGYLRLRQQGGDTVIDWDSDGGANSFVPLVRLQGVTATALTAENLGFAPDGSDTSRLFLIGTAASESLSGAAGDDYLLGGSGNDTLFGGAGADVLLGEDGNDSLDGGSGADTLAGGPGNDTYVVRSKDAVVIELANQGIDTIRSWVSITLPAHVENLILEAGAGALSGTGNELDNVLTGNESDNVLRGGPGNDLLDGGGGSDKAVYAGNRADYVVTAISDGFIITDTRAGADTDGSDTVRGVEFFQFANGTAAAADVVAGTNLTPNTSDPPTPTTPATPTTPTTPTAPTTPEIRFSVFLEGAWSDQTAAPYSGPVAYVQFQLLGTAGGEVAIGTPGNDFINLLGGDDAANGDAGDDVLDGGLGSNFLTGGAGFDVFFLDGRSGQTTWSTITDWEAGEQLSLWGWRPGISRATWIEGAGTAGFQGATLHCDLDGNGTIDASVTWAGITRAALPPPFEFDGLLWFK